MVTEGTTTVWWHLSAEAVSALVATLAAVWAIAAQIREWRRSRIAIAFEILARLDDRYDALACRAERKKAAKHLLEMDPTDHIGDGAVISILNFFEGVAYPWKKELIDTEAVWHSFGAWLLPYYRAAESIRLRERASDPDAYTDLDELFVAVKDFKKVKYGELSVEKLLSRAAIDGFLMDESRLPDRQ